MAENKTKPTKASVAKFLAAVEPARRREEAQVVLKLYEKATGLPAVLWGPSIVGFGSVHYKYATGREGDMPAAGFSPRKANMTFYIYGSFDGAKQLFAKLGKHKRSVACVYVNKLEDIDLGVLREIVERQFRHDLANSA